MERVEELAYFKNDGPPATVKAGVVERADIASWVNARIGAADMKVMRPDQKESGKLTVAGGANRRG